MIRRPVIALLGAVLLLSACEQIQSWTGDKAGTAPEAATSSDQGQITAAEQRAYTAPIGQQVTWTNPDNGDSGNITVVKDGYSQQGAYCRQFQIIVTSGGQAKKSFSSACQMPDGSWKPAQ